MRGVGQERKICPNRKADGRHPDPGDAIWRLARNRKVPAADPLFLHNPREIDLAGQLGFGDKLTAEVRLNDFSKEKLNHGTEINHMLQPYLVTV